MISVSLKENVPDSALVGGKAVNLTRLRKFNVPDGICITTKAYINDKGFCFHSQ